MSDRDNVLHHVENWEELLTRPDPLAEAPTFATADHPLKMYVLISALHQALEDSLYSISQNRERCDVTPELKAESDGLVLQRKAALAWLAEQPREHVFLALYPTTEFELVEEEPVDDSEDEPQE